MVVSLIGDESHGIEFRKKHHQKLNKQKFPLNPGWLSWDPYVMLYE